MTARTALAAARAHRVELRRDARLLRPGLWVIDDGRIARHWRQPRPPPPLGRATGGRGRGRSTVSGLLRSTARRLSSVVWVPKVPVSEVSEQAHAHAYTLRLPRTYAPESVMFDLEGRRVLRVRHDGPDAARVDVPTRLGRHVAIPAFEVLGGGTIFVEEFVDGETLARTTDPTRRLRAAADLLERYAALTRAERGAPAGPLVEAALDSAHDASLPTELARWLDRHGGRLRERAAGWPLVPAHSDLTPSNVVMRDDDPVVIDFEWAGYYPFFYDPASLILRDAAEERRGDLLDACLRGHMDGGFAALCAAAKCPVEDPPTLLVATLLVRCDRSARRSNRLDRARYERYVARLWGPLDGMLDEGEDR